MSEYKSSKQTLEHRNIKAVSILTVYGIVRHEETVEGETMTLKSLLKRYISVKTRFKMAS